jgi:hypothetical protein
MITRLWTFVSFALLAGLIAQARQIPIVNGVIGGVPEEHELNHVDLLVKPAITPAATTPGKLRVVENSGICETTPSVYQASGYGDLTSSESIWFWFFAARKNSDTAPLAIWLNGGVSRLV